VDAADAGAPGGACARTGTPAVITTAQHINAHLSQKLMLPFASVAYLAAGRTMQRNPTWQVEVSTGSGKRAAGR